MDIIESAMAFSITMIIFSTMVTGIVEFLFRVSSIRHRYFIKMLEALFKVIWARLSTELIKNWQRDNPEAPKATPDSAIQSDIRAQFLEEMTQNPLAPHKKSSLFLPGSKIKSLTSESFAERLAGSVVGKALSSENVSVTNLVTEFAQSFDRYGRAASEYLTTRARTLSIIVAIFLAFAVNINAERLFMTLLENPSLRLSLNSQIEDAKDDNKEAIASLNAVKAALENNTDPNQNKDAIQEITATVDSLKGQFNATKSIGLPIGYDYFPWGERKSGEVDESKNLILWALMCLISGILIGLGGPFWFQVFTKFSQLSNLGRALGLGKSDASHEATTPPQSHIMETYNIASGKGPASQPPHASNGGDNHQT